jgi:hypothetical protein
LPLLCTRKIPAELNLDRIFCGYLSEVPLSGMRYTSFRHAETLLATCEQREGIRRMVCGYKTGRYLEGAHSSVFSEPLQSYPPDTPGAKYSQVFVPQRFPPIHSAHYNNKLY